MHLPSTPLEEAESVAARRIAGAKGHAFSRTATHDGVLRIDPTKMEVQGAPLLV